MPWEQSPPPASPVSPAPQSEPAPRAPSKIPPPPVEVIIRTLESDTRSLAESGGARVQGETLKLHELEGRGGGHSALHPALVIFGFLLLAAAVYFSFFYR